MADLFPMRATDVVVKRRGKTVLGPVTLTLDSKGFTVLIGPNGAGKTTLLKALHGVERLSGGSISWAVPRGQAQSRQSYVFQTPIMLRRSVRDNLAYPLQLVGLDKASIARESEVWAARIGLSDVMDRSAKRLSGGERQKLALGRAMIRAPDMLFLDEPCANLDGRATREIEALLADVAQSGTRIMMATHDMGQVRRLAQDVIFLRKGLVHEHGPVDAILTAPETPELRAFLKGDIVE